MAASRARGRRSRRRRGSRSSRGRSRRTPPPSRAGRCRRGRDRCCRRSSGARAARGRPRRPCRPRARRRAARRRRRRRAARASPSAAARGAAPRGAGAALVAPALLALRERLRARSRLLRGSVFCAAGSLRSGVAPRRRRGAGLLAPAPAAATAAALGLRGIGCVGGGRVGGGRLGRADGFGLRPRRVRQGVSCRRLVFASSEPGQAKTPCRASRATLSPGVSGGSALELSVKNVGIGLRPPGYQRPARGPAGRPSEAVLRSGPLTTGGESRDGSAKPRNCC